MLVLNYKIARKYILCLSLLSIDGYALLLPIPFIKCPQICFGLFFEIYLLLILDTRNLQFLS